MKTIDELWKKVGNVELIQVRPEEMESLYKRCFEFELPFVVEIGSAHGASSIILAEAVKELQGQLVCIDSYPEKYYDQEKFGNYAKRMFIRNLKGYNNVRLIALSSTQALPEIKKLVHAYDEFEVLFIDEFEVLFIDGDHSYEAVKQDCDNYLPLLVSGGYVAFHDYNNVAYSGVKQAADEATGTWEKTDDVWDMIIRKKP